MSTPSARLLELLSLLQSRRDWPGSLLSERLQISPRTVRRDVDQLRGLGYRIAAIKGPDGGYRLGPGSELPPLLFDDDQAVALTVALQLATGAGADIDEAALRALTTVRTVLPARLRRRIDALQVTPVTLPPAGGAAEPPTVKSATLVAIGAAIHAHEVLRFAYAAAPDAEPTRRRVEPARLVSWQRRWYLVAWDLERDDWRVFRADRIEPRSPIGLRFTPRDLSGGDLDALLASRFRGATAGSTDWPCRGTAVLRRRATEIQPYVRDGLVEPVDDERCRLTLGSWSWNGLAAAIAGFDAQIESAEPPELVDAFATLAARCSAVAT